MAMPKERPSLAIMIGKALPKKDGDRGGGEGGEEEGPSGGKYDDDGMIAAAQDALDAMKTRDARALNEALCHWMELHADYESEGGESSGGDEEPEKDY